LEGGFPGAGLGVAGVDAEDGGDEAAEIAELEGDRGALGVAGADLGDQGVEFGFGEGFGGFDQLVECGAGGGEGGDRAFQCLDGASDAGIGAVGVEVAVVPGLLEISHGIRGSC
jgi:hypothetical protein